MKKSVFRICSVAAAILAVVALACAFTATGGGFLDLSNLARCVLIAVAVIFTIAAVIFGRKSRRG